MIVFYFDSCCYSRAHDDHNIERNKLEHAAILAIVERREHFITGSTVVTAELKENRNTAAREAALWEFWQTVDRYFESVPEDDVRALELQAAGLGFNDSHHLAVAERIGADVLITVDDDFERISTKKKLSRVSVINPLTYVGGKDGV